MFVRKKMKLRALNRNHPPEMIVARPTPTRVPNFVLDEPEYDMACDSCGDGAADVSALCAELVRVNISLDESAGEEGWANAQAMDVIGGDMTPEDISLILGWSTHVAKLAGQSAAGTSAATIPSTPDSARLWPAVSPLRFDMKSPQLAPEKCEISMRDAEILRAWYKKLCVARKLEYSKIARAGELPRAAGGASKFSR